MQIYIDLAVQQARKSTLRKQFGAILIHRNKVIVTGYNYTTKLSNLNRRCLLRG